MLLITILSAFLDSNILRVRKLKTGNLGRVPCQCRREQEFLDREGLGVFDIRFGELEERREESWCDRVVYREPILLIVIFRQ